MRILLGMSGGLDSTYAALLLKRAGHDVEGAVLVMHDFTDVEAAKESAEALGIPLHVIDCRELFSRTVIRDFLDEYSSARTPNPCIICNGEVKFRALCDFAKENGFDKIATGHYARVLPRDGGNNGKYVIGRAADLSKDQTYMLWRLSDDILSMLVLPLADVIKSEAREDATEAGLVAADREESQEICFIPDNDYASYIEKRVGAFPEGDFIDERGEVLGRHKGIVRYTVGQRKGLGVALGARAFVTDIDPKENKVVLSFSPKTTDRVRISKIRFSGIDEPRIGETIKASVKLRYLAPLREAEIRYLGDGAAEIILSESASSVTPGQSAVFYDNDRLVFGGFID